MSLLERKLLRDIGRRRGQFIAILATVFLGVVLFGASFDAYNNLTASYAEMFRRTNFAALTIEGGNPTTIADAMRAQDGVASVETRLVADLPFRVNGKSLIGRVIGVPAGQVPAVDDVLMQSGDRPAAGDTLGVVVERHMADNFDLKAGDTFDVFTPSGWTTLNVTGVGASSEYVWPARSRQEVFTMPDQFGVVFGAQQLLESLPPQLVSSQVLLTTTGPADDTAVTNRLTDAALAAGASDTYTQAEQASNATLNEDITGFGEMSILFPLMFLTAAGLATYVLLSRMILAQRQQVGLLLAVGFSRRRVFGHYMGFGLLIGLVASVAGALVGLALAGIITRVYTGVIGIPVIVVDLRPTTVVLGVVFGVVAGALSALFPALRAARMSPAAAMAASVGTGIGSRSVFERIVPALSRLSARWRMVLRGLGRSRVRSLSTIVGVMIAVTLVLVSWGMIDTVGVLIDQQFNQAEQQDATLALPTGVTDQDLAAATGTQGVADAEPLTHVGVTIVHGSERYTTTMAGFPADTVMHQFLGAPSDGLRANGILVGSALRKVLGVNAGDQVTLQFSELAQPMPDAGAVTTTIAGFVDEPLGTFAYVSQDQLSQMIGADNVSAATREINIKLAPGADRQATFDRLSNLPDVAAVVDAQALQRVAESLMGLFYAFVGVMLVLGAVMAFAVLFNLMAANISERVTELASLRAAGMHGAELSRIITAENVLLTVAGIVPGLAVGYLVSWEFMATFSSDLFSFDLHVQPTTFLFTAVGVLVAALVSQVPILRSVRGIDIARVVRERAS